MKRPINVLQFTCPSGFYGAERWILALSKNLEPDSVYCGLAITIEDDTNSQELTSLFRAQGKDVFEVKMNGRFDITVIYKLRSLIKTHEIDIIHTHGYKSDILGLIVARIAGIKAVSTPHGFVDVSDWKLRMYFALGNKFFKWFDAVVPLSEQLCLDMKSFGVSDKKIHYIPNGVDIEEVDSIRNNSDIELSKAKGTKRIGYIGQITRRKNVKDIIDVFDELYSKHGNLELVLLGDGEQLNELKEYANQLESSSCISFVGFQKNRLDWLKSFDIFTMASVLEGIPRCLMEAMAMGIPIAAYEIPGVNQLIKHEDTGLLSPVHNKQKLAECLEQYLSDVEMLKRISSAARDRVNGKFSSKRMAEDYTELFHSLLENSAD